MNDTHIDHVEMDDVLRDLGAELDVTPSPEFAARVRTRVAETRGASPFPRWAPRWAVWGALAATAAGVIVVAATSTTVSTPVGVPPAVVTAAMAPAVAPVHLPEQVVAPVARSAEAPPARRRLAPKPALKAAAPGALGVPRATTPPVLEVITNQPALIRQAFQQAAALQREFPVNQPVIPGPIEPLTLTRVVIDPIVIPGSAEAPPGGVSPVIRRVSAADPTRSPR